MRVIYINIFVQGRRINNDRVEHFLFAKPFAKPPTNIAALAAKLCSAVVGHRPEHVGLKREFFGRKRELVCRKHEVAKILMQGKQYNVIIYIYIYIHLYHTY